jgi:hypothetical protein
MIGILLTTAFVCGSISGASDGRALRCYLGEGAVNHGILDAAMLWTYLPEPPTD